jgi:hypothetical protein
MNPIKWRRVRLAGTIAIVAGALAYLHDPPWTDRVTSGLRQWEESPPGTFFRWTTGRASFFVPATARAITLPLLAIFPGPDGSPVHVEIRVDGRFLANIELVDPKEWVRPELPLGRARGHRSFRRVDLFVSRVVGERLYGVVTGQPTIW